jgi:hypothetical protein
MGQRADGWGWHGPCIRTIRATNGKNFMQLLATPLYEKLTTTATAPHRRAAGMIHAVQPPCQLTIRWSWLILTIPIPRNFTISIIHQISPFLFTSNFFMPLTFTRNKI